MVAELLLDGLRILVGNQAEAELGSGLAREHGLGPGAGISSVDPVNVARRPRPFSLQRREAGFAFQAGDGEIGLEFLLGKGECSELLSFPIGQGPDAVVEPGDLNPAVGPFQAGEDRRQGIQGVGDCAAIRAGMQVAVGALAPGSRSKPGLSGHR